MSAADRPDTRSTALGVFDALIRSSAGLASHFGSSRTDAWHLLLALLDHDIASLALEELGIDIRDLRDRFHASLQEAGVRVSVPVPSADTALIGLNEDLLQDVDAARERLQERSDARRQGHQDETIVEDEELATTAGSKAALRALFEVIERNSDWDPFCRVAFRIDEDEDPEGLDVFRVPDARPRSAPMPGRKVLFLNPHELAHPDSGPHPRSQEEINDEIDNLISSLMRGPDGENLDPRKAVFSPCDRDDYPKGRPGPTDARQEEWGDEKDRQECLFTLQHPMTKEVPEWTPESETSRTPAQEPGRKDDLDSRDPSVVFRRASGSGDGPETRSQGDTSPGGKGGRAPSQASTLARDLEEVKAAVARSFRSLTDAAAQGRLDPVIGREREIEHVLFALQRRRKRSVILHGPSGVGKTAIAEGVAMALRGPDAPRSLANRQVLELSMSNLISGARYRGDFEERITLAINKIVEDGAIIFIDEIHTIMGLGGSSVKTMDAPNILKPVLARGDVLLIGATTTEELAVIQRDKAVARRFEMIEIREPGLEDMRRILDRSSHAYLDHHGLMWADGVDAEILDICHRWVPESRFPDKALDLLDRSCVEALRSFSDRIDVEHVRQAAVRAGIPIPRPAGPSERRRLERIRASLRASGVTEAGLETLSTSLRLQVLAPSARIGAQIWLVTGSADARDAMIIALASSMSRRPVTLSAARIASPGAADWLIGHSRLSGDNGALIEMIETAPDDIAVLDGIEAAHPDVIELLEKMASEPELRTGSGRSIATRRLSVILSCAAPREASIGFRALVDDTSGASLPKPLQGLEGRSGVCILNADQSIRTTSAIRKSLDAILIYLGLSGYSVEIADDLPARIEECVDGGSARLDLGPAGRQEILARCLETMCGAPEGANWLLDLEEGPQGLQVSVRMAAPKLDDPIGNIS